MKKKPLTNAERLLENAKHAGERKLRQDMPRHQVIPDKKKRSKRNACRGKLAY